MSVRRLGEPVSHSGQNVIQPEDQHKPVKFVNKPTSTVESEHVERLSHCVEIPPSSRRALTSVQLADGQGQLHPVLAVAARADGVDENEAKRADEHDGQRLERHDGRVGHAPARVRLHVLTPCNQSINQSITATIDSEIRFNVCQFRTTHRAWPRHPLTRLPSPRATCTRTKPPETEITCRQPRKPFQAFLPPHLIALKCQSWKRLRRVSCPLWIQGEQNASGFFAFPLKGVLWTGHLWHVKSISSI